MDSESSSTTDGEPIVRADSPETEGCPILLRVSSFVVDQGTAPTLEHTVRNRQTGALASLSPVLTDATDATPIAGYGSVDVRVAEWFANNQLDDRTAWAATGRAVDANNGQLAVQLTEAMTARAGVYRLDWGVRSAAGKLLSVSHSFAIVQRSAFGDGPRECGPPLVEEIRLALRDSDRAENFTMDGLEFSDAQLAQAIARPVAMWNTETPKAPRFTTTSFKFRDPWLDGIVGILCEIAAQGYRRDDGLIVEAGGVTSRDKAKEGVYLAEANRRLSAYRQWMLLKKGELAMSAFYGHFRSDYSYHGGWGGSW